jgi:serine/threonine-protein kinase RsbW
MATLRLSADLVQLALAREFVAQEGRKLGADDRTVRDIQLAVDEACTNIIRHAYGERGGKIQIRIDSIDDGIRVIVRDWGAAFDPEVVPHPDVAAPLSERALGGLGLFLMRQVMDSVDFAFDTDKGNVLTMVKRLGGNQTISSQFGRKS